MSPPPRAFGALRHRGFLAFFLCSAAAMGADVTEHVISYWVIYQRFHSAALGGFAVISHWVPYLTLSVYSGGLADRYDPRRLIQLGMGLFMAVSVSWGLLFLWSGAEVWHAMVLLVIHGFAGVLWNPASQVLLYDIVGPAELPSAVRLGATARYLGLLAGPGIGALLLVVMGPVWGIFLNAGIYLPMMLWLVRAPYGPKFRAVPRPARAVRGLADVRAALGTIRANPLLWSMTLLAGGASLFIGTAYQAQMPGFARDLGHGDPGVAYSVLLGADALGALTAGLLLEARGLLAPRPGTACVLAAIWCVALGGFALAHSYVLVLALLATAGFVELSFNTMAQTLVQLNAPDVMRGRVIGVFLMASLGLRTFSGLTVGLLGSLVGVHASLALSAGAFLLVTLGLIALIRGRRDPGLA